MIIVAAAILGCALALAGLWLFRKKQVCVRPEVKLLIELIRAGKDWKRNRYAMWHPSGPCIWIANEAYGIGVKWDAKHHDDYVSRSSETDYKLNSFERRAIWSAVQGGGSSGREAIHRFAKRVEEMYAEPRP